MQTTRLSGTDKSLSLIGLGCSRIGSFNNPTPIADIRRLLEASFELGVTLYDTADIYGQGDSERELGRFLTPARRDKAFVLTKAGKLFSAKMRLMRPFKPLIRALLPASSQKAVAARREGNMAQDFSPAHLRAAVEGSRRRLKADILDGLVLHSPDARAAADPAVWDALADLKRTGKLAAYGTSCDTIDVLEACLAMPGQTLLELPHDVIVEAQARGLSARIAEQGILVVAREAIRFQPALKPLDAVRNTARLPAVTSVVVGTSKLNHLEDIIDAVAG